MGNRLARLAILAVAVGTLGSPALAAGKGQNTRKPTVKPAAAPPESGTWRVTVVPESSAAASGEKEFDDTLVLGKGKFKSTACVLHGFGPAAYTVLAGTWLANVQSQQEGETHWHAEVSGDAISGKMTWTKPDGTALNYSFSGARAGGQGTQTQKPH
jgi:hypothetical protein